MVTLAFSFTQSNSPVIPEWVNVESLMTGGQDSAGTGRIEAICAGIGVDPAHIRVVTPLKKNYEEMKQIIREEIEYRGVSVIIPRMN